MREEVRQDIIAVLSGTLDALKHNDSAAIAEWSDRVIHDASVFQDEDSISVAVLVYAISKIVSRSVDAGTNIPDFTPMLDAGVESLREYDYSRYNSAIKKAFELVRKIDVKLGIYVGEVIEKSRLKKGSRMHEHGISIGRVAFLLGISKWELMYYVGKTAQPIEEGVSVLKRLQFAREFFS